jgi:hypothetical protein
MQTAKKDHTSFRKTEDDTAYYFGLNTYEQFHRWARDRRDSNLSYTFTEFYSSLRAVQRLAIGIEIFQESDANESHK